MIGTEQFVAVTKIVRRRILRRHPAATDPADALGWAQLGVVQAASAVDPNLLIARDVSRVRARLVNKGYWRAVDGMRQAGLMEHRPGTGLTLVSGDGTSAVIDLRTVRPLDALCAAETVAAARRLFRGTAGWQVFDLYYLRQMPITFVANTINISVGLANEIRSRVCRALREQLDRGDDAP